MAQRRIAGCRAQHLAPPTPRTPVSRCGMLQLGFSLSCFGGLHEAARFHPSSWCRGGSVAASDAGANFAQGADHRLGWNLATVERILHRKFFTRYARAWL